MAKVTAIRRPRYSRNTVLQRVNTVARAIAEENDGRVPDVFSIDVRLRQLYENNPELILLDKIARDDRRFWERANNNAVLRNPAGIWVPGAFISVGKRARVVMVKMKMLDLFAWAQKDAEAEEGFMAGQRRKAAYRAERIAEWRDNPDCSYLADLETKLHGYSPSEDDETGHFDDEDEPADIET